MQNIRKLIFAFMLIASANACSRGLNHQEAKTVVEQHPLIRTTDSVSVDAISIVNDAESIVRATIAGHTTNLKFRRYDTGWTWEFVETKAGGWIAPEVAVGQIREEHRTKAATEWAKQNADGYANTAKTMNYVHLFQVLNPSEWMHFPIWLQGKEMLGKMWKKRENENADAKLRSYVLNNDRWLDAWGSELHAAVNRKDDETLILSVGPDKTHGTEDDLSCLTTHQRGYEDGRQVWRPQRTWRLPEGLGNALDSFFDKDNDRIEYSKVAKP